MKRVNFPRLCVCAEFLGVVLLFSGPANAGWQFTEVSESAGASYLHGFDIPVDDDELSISGGVAAGDYDNDGDVDLYVVTGNAAENALLQNNGDGSFTNVTTGSGVGLPGHKSSGPAFADIDGDRWLDLVVGSILGETYYVFKNNRDGTFSDFTAQSGITNLNADQNNYSSAFGDPDKDGDLDLFVAHHTFIKDIPWNNYWRNDGSGVFTASDAWANITVWDSGADSTFSPVFTDLNGDGWQDLAVASDFGRSQYFINDQTGKFTLSTTQVINDQYGMGAATGDFDNDGDIDWFVTSIYDDPQEQTPFRTGNRLYMNDGSGVFSEIAAAAGVDDGQWGWGACAADFNNDGWLDLFHVNGYPPLSTGSLYYNDDPARLFINNQDGVSYTESAASLGIADGGQGRGVVCFDYDQDGDIDVFVSKNDGLTRLYRNDLEPNPGYLQVELRPFPANRTIVGAVIEVDTGSLTQRREVTIGSNFESQNPLLQHFGLGGATIIDEVRVQWPDGPATTLHNVAVNQKLLINQNSGLFYDGFESP